MDMNNKTWRCVCGEIVTRDKNAEDTFTIHDEHETAAYWAKITPPVGYHDDPEDTES
jgi:uncharacterized RmlC-like cupin family protein